jgi:uncharacterized Zn finger protein (UPF0148 family)
MMLCPECGDTLTRLRGLTCAMHDTARLNREKDEYHQRGEKHPSEMDYEERIENLWQTGRK